MSGLWMALAWIALGAMAGASLSWPTRALLAARHRDHPLVATATLTLAVAILFGLLAWRIGIHLELLPYGSLAAIGVPLAASDLVGQRMPSALLLPAYPVLTMLLGLTAVIEHHGASMLRSLAGMVILFLFYLVVALLASGALGAADIRLAGVLGLALGWRGWTTLVAGTILGLFCASLAGAILIVLRRAHRHTPIPCGPALIAGALTAVLVPIG